MYYEDLIKKDSIRLAMLQSKIREYGRQQGRPFSGRDIEILTYEVDVHTRSFEELYIIVEQLHLLSNHGFTYRQIIKLRSCYYEYDYIIDYIKNQKGKVNPKRVVQELIEDLEISHIEEDRIQIINGIVKI